MTMLMHPNNYRSICSINRLIIRLFRSVVFTKTKTGLSFDGRKDTFYSADKMMAK